MNQLVKILLEIKTAGVINRKLIQGKIYKFISPSNTYNVIYKGCNNSKMLGKTYVFTYVIDGKESKNKLELSEEELKKIQSEDRLYVSGNQNVFKTQSQSPSFSKLIDGQEYDVFKDNNWQTFLYHKSRNELHEPHLFLNKDNIKQGFSLSNQELEKLLQNKEIKPVNLNEIQIIGSKVNAKQVFDLLAYMNPIDRRIDLIKKYIDPLGYLNVPIGLLSFLNTLDPRTLSKLYKDISNEIR